MLGPLGSSFQLSMLQKQTSNTVLGNEYIGFTKQSKMYRKCTEPKRNELAPPCESGYSKAKAALCVYPTVLISLPVIHTVYPCYVDDGGRLSLIWLC